MVTGSKTMDIEQPKNTEIALNVTRTRITVRVFSRCFGSTEIISFQESFFK